MFEIRKLSVRYPNQVAPLFKDCSTTLESGQILWLRGANGSGKTTLLYAISNVIPQSIAAYRTGEILMDGEFINDVPINLLTPKLSLMLSNPMWEFIFTQITDEITYPLENLGLSDVQIAERIAWVVGMFGLESVMHIPTHHLSAGWKKMIALSIHAVVLPRVLLLDEPFSELSDSNAERVLCWMQDFSVGGGRIIVADHTNIIEQLHPIVYNLG